MENHVFNVERMGSLSIGNVFSWIDQWDQQELAGAPTEACAGNWGFVCGFPTPDLRNKLRVIWETPWDLALTGMWRYTSKVEDLNETDIDLKAASYFDLSAVWDATGNTQVRFGINNLFDEEPPIAGNGAGPSISGNGNTFPGMYDALGQYWFLAAGVTF